MKYRNISHPLKDMIRKHYTSIEEFTDVTGLSKRTLYDIFENKRANVRDDVKVIIAKNLNLSYEEVFNLVYATR